MNLPGFSGEISLSKTSALFRARLTHRFPAGGRVLPQSDCLDACNRADDRCKGSNRACLRKYIKCVNSC